MDWKENIRRWRTLPRERQQRLSLARSALQVWQSMEFEGQTVSLEWLKQRHEYLLKADHGEKPLVSRIEDASPARVNPLALCTGGRDASAC